MVGLGGLGLVWTLATHESAREYVDNHYRFVGAEAIEGDKDSSKVYASTQSVTRTAKDIADGHKPADRRVTESGVFLRYKRDIIAVVPRPEGTRILVDDEDSGYRHHYTYVGGWWGSYSGPAESFRGGGAGGGGK